MISCCLRTLIYLVAIAVLFAAVVVAASVLQIPVLDYLSNVPVEYVFLVIGVIVVGSLIVQIFGTAQRGVDGLVEKAVKPGQKQTIKFETKETPSEIAWAAVWATVKLFGVLIFLLFILFVLVFPLTGGFVGAGPIEVFRSFIDSIRR